MITHFLEATNGPRNWGKFMIARFDEREWAYRSALPEDGMPLIRGRGWSPRHFWMLDLQTGEGAIFMPGGLASADLHKHQIWTCPMFPPTLAWLYEQDLTDLTKLPAHIDLPDVEFQWAGSRGAGPAAA